MGYSSFLSACPPSLRMPCTFCSHKSAYICRSSTVTKQPGESQSYYRLNISLFMHASLVPRPFLKEKTRRNEKHFSYELHLTCSVLFSVPQVNASPSLSHTTPSDRIMKTSLINDIINIVLSPSGFPEYASMKSSNREKHDLFLSFNQATRRIPVLNPSLFLHVTLLCG